MFNQAEAEAHEGKFKTIPNKPKAKLPSPTNFTDSDDNINDNEEDIFEYYMCLHSGWCTNGT